MDLSHLDNKYFIDNHIYNCPFCKRNNVLYSISEAFEFDWTSSKKCYGYLIKCSSCDNISLHWSWKELRKFVIYNKLNNNGAYSNEFLDALNLDKEIFFSRPSSFFTLDNNIPDNIRQLIFESEQSRQANLLVGASACLRKAIYELLKKEGAIIKNDKTGYADYEASIKQLKEKNTHVDHSLLDALGNIQEMVSNPLHEESWKAWDSQKLRFLIELFKTILEEMYIVPAQRKKRLATLTKLKSDYEEDKGNSKNKTETI